MIMNVRSINFCDVMEANKIYCVQQNFQGGNFCSYKTKPPFPNKSSWYTEPPFIQKYCKTLVDG